jgi:hypothetical protein
MVTVRVNVSGSGSAGRSVEPDRVPEMLIITRYYSGSGTTERTSPTATTGARQWRLKGM